MLDWQPDAGRPVPLAVLFHPDAHVATTIGYGAPCRPEDYLIPFGEFLRANENQLAALSLVLRRPRDLTQADRRALALALQAAGFSKTALRSAWREAKQEDVAARLIGFVRQAALGDAPEPRAERVQRAVEAITKRGGLAFAGYLIRARPRREHVEPAYLLHMMSSPSVREIIELNARSSSGVYNINAAELAALRVPLPSLDERQRAVHRIERATAHALVWEADAARSLALLDRLEQSILARAFRGELVPQDSAKIADVIAHVATDQNAPTTRRRRMRAVAAKKNELLAQRRNTAIIQVEAKPRLYIIGEARPYAHLQKTVSHAVLSFQCALSRFFQGWIGCQAQGRDRVPATVGVGVNVAIALPCDAGYL